MSDISVRGRLPGALSRGRERIPNWARIRGGARGRAGDEGGLRVDVRTGPLISLQAGARTDAPTASRHWARVRGGLRGRERNEGGLPTGQPTDPRTNTPTDTPTDPQADSRTDPRPSRRAAPTARGYAVACLGVLCAVGGRTLGYPELTALAGACLAALAVAAFCLASGRRLGVDRAIAPAKVARGGDAVGTVRVRNLGRRHSRALTAIDRVGPDAVRVAVPALARGAATTVGYRLPTTRRGELAVGPLLLRSDDPLGLARRVLVYGAPATVLVRPRTVPLTAVPTGHRASLDGPTSQTAQGGTTAFHTLREYVPGDDLRHVHWRTSARTDTLMVRHLVDSALPETVVVLDLRATSYPGGDSDLDVAVDAAATIAAGMGAEGFPATVYTTAGDRLRIRGVRTVAGLLDRLAMLPLDHRADDPAALGRIVEQARHATPAGGGLALLTGTRGVIPARVIGTARSRFGRLALMQAAATQDAATSAAPGAATGARTVDGVPLVTITCAEDAASLWQRGVRRR